MSIDQDTVVGNQVCICSYISIHACICTSVSVCVCVFAPAPPHVIPSDLVQPGIQWDLCKDRNARQMCQLQLTTDITARCSLWHLPRGKYLTVSFSFCLYLLLWMPFSTIFIPFLFLLYNVNLWIDHFARTIFIPCVRPFKVLIKQ